jgi:hypothetical protein
MAESVDQMLVPARKVYVARLMVIVVTVRHGVGQAVELDSENVVPQLLRLVRLLQKLPRLDL